MYVKTQFETIINLANFDEIKFERHVKEPSGNVFHRIYAGSKEKSLPIMERGRSMRTSKSAILAEFPEKNTVQAKRVYNDLFRALSAGNREFDITDYFPLPDSTEDSTC